MTLEQLEDATLSADFLPGASARTKPAADPALSVCIAFGIGTIGTAVLLNTVTVYLPAFLSTVLGRSAALGGMLLTISKIYDIFFDIGIGLASDRTRSRFGRRRPYMLAGAVIGSAAFCGIFAPPILDSHMIAWELGLLLVVYSTGYSLFNVPYLALPPELARDYHGRTRLMSYRTFFVAVGQVIALSLSGWLLQKLGGNIHGYAVMGGLLALVIFLAESGTVLGLRETPAAAVHGTGSAAFVHSVRAVLTNKPFGLLMAVKFVQLLGVAASISTTLLFMLNVLRVGYAGQANFSLMQNIAIALSMPFWVRVGKRAGKRGTAFASVVIYALASLSWVLAGPGETMWAIDLRGFVMGWSAGGLLLMGSSMLPDVMDYDRLKTGIRREGAYSSAYAVVEKTGFAIAPGLIGLYLAMSGYIPTGHGHLVAQPHSAIIALYVGVAVLPATLMAVSLIFLALYRLDERALTEMRRHPDAALRTISS